MGTQDFHLYEMREKSTRAMRANYRSSEKLYQLPFSDILRIGNLLEEQLRGSAINKRSMNTRWVHKTTAFLVCYIKTTKNGEKERERKRGLTRGMVKDSTEARLVRGRSKRFDLLFRPAIAMASFCNYSNREKPLYSAVKRYLVNLTKQA